MSHFISLKSIRNQSGFSLIEILVVSILAGVVMLGIIKIGAILFKQQRQATTSTSILMVSRLLQNHLAGSKAWLNTLNHPDNNTTFSCILNSTNCSTAGGGFKLYDSGNNLVFDGSLGATTTQGYTMQGQVCNTFSPTGDNACPFQLQLTWRPNCPSSGSCLSPSITIQGQFFYQSAEPSRTIAFNSQNYNFQVIPGSPVVSNNGYKGNFQSFSANGTFTVPTGVSQIRIEVWGGGGGGGGAGQINRVCSSGGGGGGGGYAMGTFNVTEGESFSVIIGSSGSKGGICSGCNGSSGGIGGTTSVGSLINATGGDPGTGGSASILGGGGSGGLGSVAASSINSLTLGGHGGTYGTFNYTSYYPCFGGAPGRGGGSGMAGDGGRGGTFFTFPNNMAPPSPGQPGLAIIWW